MPKPSAARMSQDVFGSQGQKSPVSPVKKGEIRRCYQQKAAKTRITPAKTGVSWVKQFLEASEGYLSFSGLTGGHVDPTRKNGEKTIQKWVIAPSKMGI